MEKDRLQSHPPLTVLVTACGAQFMPGIVNCLVDNGERHIRLIGVDMEDDGTLGDMYDCVYRVPKVSDPRYVDQILSICEKEVVNVLLPIMSAELLPLLDRQSDFDRIGTTLIIGSDLLKRRPDVRAAEQQLASAMANVGYTYADRFPRLRIGFTPGFENDELPKFFKSPFSYTLANITGPIFDFGRKKKKYQAAIAAYDQARYSYEKSVIQAFTEVNTAISTYRRIKETTKLKVELRDATVKYVQLAHLQYRAGSLSYIDVLDAQRRYFDAQIGVSNALRDEYLALINLYKVLGGGWDNPTPKNA